MTFSPLSKTGHWALRNSRAILLLLAMTSPSFAVADTDADTDSTIDIPYILLRDAEKSCREIECEDVYIKKVNITDDDHIDFEIYFTGRLSRGSAGYPVMFIFSEDGKYKSVDEGLVVPVDSIQWLPANGKSSPADFAVALWQDCSSLWGWTGVRFDIKRKCPSYRDGTKE